MRTLLSMIISLFSVMAMGQSVSLRFDTELDCVTAEYCATLQIKNEQPGSAINIGSSSVFFNYNADALVYKSYESIHFNGSDLCLLDILSSWEEHGIDVNTPGIVNITLNLQYTPMEGETEASCPAITDEWTDISEICFTVVPNSDTLDIWFPESQGLISFNNYYPNNGVQQLPEGLFENTNEAIDCIMMLAPVAVIDSIVETAPFTFSFYGENSFDEDGMVAAHYWDFGDGTTALGANAQHTYEESGNYTITLEVVDNEGFSNETTSTVQVVETIVEVSGPNAIITVSPYSTSNGPTNVTLDAYQSTTENGEISYYEWYLNNILISGSDFIEVYLIEDTSYEIILEVTDEDNLVDSDTVFLELATIICDTNFVYEETVLYETASCNNTPINLNGFIENDFISANAVWTNEEGDEILNPAAYAVSNWGCEVVEELLTIDYSFFNQENCELTVHQDQVLLSVYSSISASVSPLNEACGIQINTCPTYEVSWNDGSTSGDGSIYLNSSAIGQVTFTVNNPNAPAECNSKSYTGFNYCTSDLEVRFEEEFLDVQMNQAFEVNLFVSNKGSLPATNIYLDYSNEIDVAMIGMVSTDFTGLNNQWFLPSLTPGEEKMLTITLLPQSMGELTFDAWIADADGEDSDSYPGNMDLSEDDMARLSITSELIDCSELCPQSSICIAPLTPTVLCPSFCTLDATTVITVLEYNSLFDCSIEVSFNNCLVYLPIPGMEDAEIPDQLTILAEDGNGNCEMVIYTITVGDCLLPPIAENDYIVVVEDITVLPVLDNDSDPNGDEIYICGINQPTFGLATLVDGVLTYEPNDGFVGTDLFTYEVCDGLFSSIGIVYLIVDEEACETDNQYACVSPGETITLCPSFCGFDELNNIDGLTASEGGVLVNLDNGCFRYRPLETYVGNEEVLAITCLSQQNFCDTVRYTVQVDPTCQPNNSNIAYLADDYDTTLVNTTVFIDVLANDELPLNENIEICQITGLSTGTAEITVNQQIAFTPAEDYMGSVSFSYIICDENGNETATGFVFVEVLESLNDCNIYREVCTKPMQAIEICMDFCVPNLFIFDMKTTFNCGISHLTSNCFRYQPLPGLIGTDTINVVYCDENGSCFTGKIDVHIKPDCDEERLSVSSNCDPIILNVLTPNNDGINDAWLVDEQFTCWGADYFEIEIFDRYGTRVCVQESSFLENGHLIWNGQYENTQSHVPEGIYFYKINIEHKNSLTIRTGFLEVRR